MTQFDIAIIIPCYNGWKYMAKCLDALERQTVAPRQVIVVDDCSTDDSFESLRCYARASSLPLLVHRNSENCGPGKSRENGLKLVQTKYVAFCDCDDWFEYDFVEKIADCAAADQNIDLVIFDNYICSEAGEKKQGNTTKAITGRDKARLLATYQMSLCRLAVRTDIVRGISFPPLFHGEDGVVAVQIISGSHTIQVLDLPLYNYLTRIGSASTKPSENAFREFVSAYEIIAQKLESQYPEESEFIGIKYVCYGAVLNALKCGISKKEIDGVLRQFKKSHPHWIKNPYIATLPRTKRIYIRAVWYRMLFFVDILTKIHTHIIEAQKG